MGSSFLSHAKDLANLGSMSSRVDVVVERRNAMAFYTKIHEEHWLRDKVEDGRIVILEDESMWEVHPSDRLITKRWLRISTITVKHTSKNGYPYLLSNSTEEEDARANYLGESTPRINDIPAVA